MYVPILVLSNLLYYNLVLCGMGKLLNKIRKTEIMVVKCSSEQLHMRELLRWDCGIRVFYANPAFSKFAYFFYKFSLFTVGTLDKINIF